MDHVVYLDAKARELDKLLAGQKRIIVRGATGRKLPYGRVNPGDHLFFILNNGEGMVRACAVVSQVLNSDQLTIEQSHALLEKNQPDLNLTPEQYKRWAGKRYLVLVTVQEIQPLEPFSIHREEYGNMDDWLPVGSIEKVKTN